MAEGSQWEAMEIAAYYKLDNLIGIIDVNRLGQRGETMYGWDLDVYAKRINAFGWETILIDGHNFSEIRFAYQKAVKGTGKPTMIIAKTIKGKGVPLVEDKNGWHGKPLSREQLKEALQALGEVDRSLRGKIAKPADLKPEKPTLASHSGAFVRAGETFRHEKSIRQCVEAHQAGISLPLWPWTGK